MESRAPVPTLKPDGSDVFGVHGFSRTTQPILSLKQLPKWLSGPVSGSFGYGGQLVSVETLPTATGRNQTSVVHLMEDHGGKGGWRRNKCERHTGLEGTDEFVLC